MSHKSSTGKLHQCEIEENEYSQGGGRDGSVGNRKEWNEASKESEVRWLRGLRRGVEAEAS